MSGSQVDNKAIISDAIGTINKFCFGERFLRKLQIQLIHLIRWMNRLAETGSYEVFGCVSMLVCVCLRVFVHIVEK